MSEKHHFSLNRCYGIFFLVVTVLLGCLFILQAADTYFTAIDAREAIRQQAAAEGWSDKDTAVAVTNIPIYSRQIAGQRLKKLLPYVCIWLGTLIGAIVIAAIRPSRPNGKRDSDCMLEQKVKAGRRRLPTQAKAGQDVPFSAAMSQYLRIRKQSRYLMIALGVITAGCLLFPLLYLADFSHFPNEDLNGEVIAAVLYILPFLLILLAGSLAYVFLRHRMMKAEFAAIKEATAAGDRSSILPAEKKRSPLLWIFRIALLVIGVVLVAVGTQDGSMYDVLTKATKICTECIGLG